MKLKELVSFLDSAIPLSFQEKYDNSGLQTGDPEKVVKSALLTLDVTDEVLEEAVRKHCDIIISHHPVIFTPLKRLSGRSETERIIIKAIKNDVAIYSAHTNLDVLQCGVSRKMAEKLDLVNVNILSPLEGRLCKLVTFIPDDYKDSVSRAIFEAGAGVIGNYDHCGFTISGTGSFRGNEKSNPFKGAKGSIHLEKEVRFETVLFTHMKNKVIKALLKAHPYEEVAYDIYPLDNTNTEAGLGCAGDLKKPLSDEDFISTISKVFSARGIRHSRLTGKKIKRIAVCGGSCGALLNEAISSGADAFITADVKYHTFLEAQNRILVIDTGHYESEKFSIEILNDLIIKNFPKFALRFSEINTNPINFY